VTAEEVAARIAAEPAEVVAVLHDELSRGRVTRDGDRWSLVPGAFAPDVVAALRQLA
jgi:hypothetical protein